jgi:hypothetical protein
MAIKVSDDIARALAESGGYFRTKRGGWVTTHVDPNNPEAVAKAHAVNKKERDEADREKAKSKGKPPKWLIRNRLRLCELAEAFEAYHGSKTLPATPGGVADLKLMVQHILFVHRDDSPCAAARHWAAVRAPWCNEEDLDLIIDEIGPVPHFMKDDELAEALEVTDEIRARYGWRTIGAIDVDEEQRKAINREKDRKRKEAERRANGVEPRKQFESTSKARTKPWVALGVSESTYYRRLSKEQQAAAAAINSDRGVSETNFLSLSGTHYCHDEARPEGRASEMAVGKSQVTSRLREIGSNRNVMTGLSPAEGNPQAGAASKDNLPPPAEWETPTQVAA